jgi:hypothetical protein
MTFFRSPPRMKMAVLVGVWNPIAGPLSPERQPLGLNLVAARRSAPTLKVTFMKVFHAPVCCAPANENGIQPTKWAKECSPGQSERRRSRSDVWRATPWVIVYPRLLLLDQARAGSPRLIEELSSISESYSQGYFLMALQAIFIEACAERLLRLRAFRDRN